MRRLPWASSIGLLLIASAPTSLAATATSRITFADVISRSKLVVLATVDAQADGGFTFHVERVLKGPATTELHYPPIAITPPFDGWSRVVIAFADPTTDDFRAPTIAWHVSDDGTIDPERFQPYSGLPLTLDALIRYFDPPATDTAASVTTSTAPTGNARLAFVLLAAGAGSVLALWRFRRRVIR